MSGVSSLVAVTPRRTKIASAIARALAAVTLLGVAGAADAMAAPPTDLARRDARAVGDWGLDAGSLANIDVASAEVLSTAGPVAGKPLIAAAPLAIGATRSVAFAATAGANLANGDQTAGSQLLPWMQHWRGNETRLLQDAEWVEYTVVPGDTLSELAVRFGTTSMSLVRNNRIGSRGPRPGSVLRVHATRLPPAPVSVLHVVAPGESWGDVAALYRVDPTRLRALHAAGGRELEAGRELIIWVDTAAPWTTGRGALLTGAAYQGALMEPIVASGGMSVGTPNKGKLQNGVQLPESPLYTRRMPDLSWGSTSTIRAISSAILAFRRDTHYGGEIIIGSVSRHHGGRFRPHRSHQSGRDVDIRLPVLPGLDVAWRTPKPDEIDWIATYRLMEAMFDTGKVEVIFLSYPLQHRLYEAARSLGVPHEVLQERIQWAGARHFGQASVHHERGHDGHMHVRFDCGDDEPRCRQRR